MSCEPKRDRRDWPGDVQARPYAMNYQLFSAFLLITFVLVIVPGPIVTLVITTGATRGIRAALMTVLGSTLGNAVLITAIALGLNWILRTSAEVFEILRWTGAAYLVWLGIQAWRHAGEQGEVRPATSSRLRFPRLSGGHDQSQDHRVLYGVPAAVRRSATARWSSAGSDVRGFRRDGGGHGCGMGHCRGRRPCPVSQAG